MLQKLTKIKVPLSLLLTAACLLSLQGGASAFYPDNTTRQDALAAATDFNNNILATPDNWNGSTSSCNADSPGAAYTQATLDTVNYFRSFDDLPAVTFNPAYSADAQQAALMMGANDQLSHTPPSSWLCYTTTGAQAAGTSNLCLGCTGPYAIMAYMTDDGNLGTLGHRRWVLSGSVSVMGSGDTYNANALYISMGGTPVAGVPKFAGWPSANYFPIQLTPSRWSLSNSDQTVDMSAAQVAVTINGQTSTESVIYMPVGYGDDTIAWDMPNLNTAYPFPDTPVQVTVSGLKNLAGSALPNYSYTTILFDGSIDSTLPGGYSDGSGITTGSSGVGSTNKKTTKTSSNTATNNGSTPTVQPPKSPRLTSLNGISIAAISRLDFSSTKSLNFSGTTVPNGLVNITLHSRPKTYIVTADKSGNWHLTLSGIPVGSHYIDSSVTDPTTKLTSPVVKLLSFKIYTPVSQTSIKKSDLKENSMLIISACTVLLLLTIAVLWVILRIRQHKKILNIKAVRVPARFVRKALINRAVYQPFDKID